MLFFAKLKAKPNGLGSSIGLESDFPMEDGNTGGTVVKWTEDATIGIYERVGSRMFDSAAHKYINGIIVSLRQNLS